MYVVCEHVKLHVACTCSSKHKIKRIINLDSYFLWDQRCLLTKLLLQLLVAIIKTKTQCRVWHIFPSGLSFNFSKATHHNNTQQQQQQPQLFGRLLLLHHQKFTLRILVFLSPFTQCRRQTFRICIVEGIGVRFEITQYFVYKTKLDDGCVAALLPPSFQL